jgi:hypothetical protein
VDGSLDRGLRRHVGKIRGLAEVLRDHPEAVRYDLLALGLHVDDLGENLSWLDLEAVISQGPSTSAIARALYGEDALWGLQEQLLAAAVDRLSWALYQNGGGKGSKPKPIPRPGTRPKKTTTARRFDSMTIEEYERRYAERLAKNAAKQPAPEPQRSE